MQFRKNFHIAKNYSMKYTKHVIKNYPKQYQTPKYLLFIKEMLANGYQVRVYIARVSKYIFLVKNDQIIKIRFSNHRPLYEKEEENDCDYYVGISHKQVSTTEQLIKKLLKK